MEIYLPESLMRNQKTKKGKTQKCPLDTCTYKAEYFKPIADCDEKTRGALNWNYVCFVSLQDGV